MNKKTWLMGVVLLFTTAFWICVLPIFKYEQLVIPGVISLGIVLVSAGIYARGVTFVKRKWGILVVPCVIAAYIIPSPFNSGFILLGIGFFILFVIPRISLWVGVALSGLILVIQSAVMAVYYFLIPSGHSATAVSYIMYPVLKIFGFVTSFDRGIIFIQKAGDVFPFPTTWDTLGVFPFIVIFVPVLLFVLLKSKDADDALKNGAGFVGVSLVYLVLRYVFLLHYYFANILGREAFLIFRQLFFSPVMMFLTFVPFVVLVTLLYTMDFDVTFPETTGNPAKIAVFCIASFLLVGAVIFQDPGSENQGRVLVDEIHSTWEPSSLVMDTHWYGTESTYNAYSMIEWLKVTYDVDRVMNTAFVTWEPGENITKAEPDIVSDEITSDILQGYDILILKTPNMYHPSEVEAIVNFVKNGGGLYVIGDHSNFAGTSTSLNEITRNFGIQFVFDSVNSAEGRLSIYKRGKITHPCAKYMPEFDFLTSCSISAPPTAGRIIPGYGLNAEPGEYASTGFFRETRRDLPILATDRTWGIFHQCVAAQYGKGRIVAFADSTTISNFRIFFGGTDAMVIGSMEWLNHSNQFGYVPKIFWGLGLVCAVAGVYVFSTLEKKKQVGYLLLVICMVGLGSGVSVAVFSPALYDYVPAEYYDWEKTVCFDQSHSSEIVNSGNREGEYSVFLIWTQRVGLVPSIENSLNACAEKGKTIIIVDPVTENFSYEDVQLLKEHVQNGGNVLMMVNQSSVLGLNVISEFGLEIEDIRKPQDAKEDQNPFVAWGPSVKGGEPIETVGERVILARVSYGDGVFVLCTVSHIFKNGYNGQPGYMGYNGSDPDDLEENARELVLKVYNLEYRIFEEVLQ
ncbi:MAG: hypothetical protein PVF58_08510 [Candidatus Methanofastidiosia archaeon]|jgi:hypothetical protein